MGKEEKLYQYRALNKFNIINILNGEIRLNSPKLFNDPYDSRLMLSNEEVIRLFIKIGNSNMTKEEINREAERLEFLLKKREDFEIFINNSREKIYNIIDDTLCIACFSERNDSMLMWSHYADYHKGICVEYSKVNLESIDKTELIKVLYTSERIISDDIGKIGIESVRRKASCWRYEKEWRLAKEKDRYSEGTNVKVEKIEGIYLGTKISKVDEEFIKFFCEKNKINLYQMKLNGQEYKFEEPKVILRF